MGDAARQRRLSARAGRGILIVCCDLDGVVWRGDEPIPGAASAIDRLRVAGRRVVFLTNNSSVTVADYIGKLARHGIDSVPDDLCTSAQVAAWWLTRHLPAGARVFPCAGPGVVEAMTAAGFQIVDDGPADAVVVGFTRAFDFDLLTQASSLIRDGARFVATNTDPTYPVAGGRYLPGGGALVAAVATAATVPPTVTGKPEEPAAAYVREHYGTQGVMVGDRPSTDGLMARRLGWPFGLVLTGVAGTDGEEGIPDPPPEYLAADLAAMVPLLLAEDRQVPR